MSISGIGGISWASQAFGKSASAQQTQQKFPGGLVDVTPTNNSTTAAAVPKQEDSAVTAFMNYMNESPEQRMQEQWLAAHGVTKAQFDAMSPAEKQKLMDKMKQEMKAEIQEKMENAAKKTDILV